MSTSPFEPPHPIQPTRKGPRYLLSLVLSLLLTAYATVSAAVAGLMAFGIMFAATVDDVPMREFTGVLVAAAALATPIALAVPVLLLSLANSRTVAPLRIGVAIVMGLAPLALAYLQWFNGSGVRMALWVAGIGLVVPGALLATSMVLFAVGRRT